MPRACEGVKGAGCLCACFPLGPWVSSCSCMFARAVVESGTRARVLGLAYRSHGDVCSSGQPDFEGACIRRPGQATPGGEAGGAAAPHGTSTRERKNQLTICPWLDEDRFTVSGESGSAQEYVGQRSG